MVKDRRPKPNIDTKYPLKRHLAVMAIVLVFALAMGDVLKSFMTDDYENNRAPNSKHNTEESIYKSDTVYIKTDGVGNPQSVTVDTYLTNNPENQQIVDKTTLTNVVNVAQSRNLPIYNDDGTITWQTNGKDVNYEGDGDPDNMPITMNVEYYLDGQKIDGEDLTGKSGIVTIKIKYDSTDYIDVNGKRTKVPYFIMCAMLAGPNMSDVSVSNGKVIENGVADIVLGMATPGLRELAGSAELGGVISNEVVIKADVTVFTNSEIVSVANGDLLSGLNTKYIDKLDFDKKVNLAQAYSKKALALSKKVAAAIVLVDKKVMPKAVEITKKATDASDIIVKAVPEVLKTLKKAAGKCVALSTISLYALNRVIDVIEEFRKTNPPPDVPENNEEAQNSEIPQENTSEENNAVISEADNDESISERIEKQEAVLAELKESDPENIAIPVIEENLDYLKKLYEEADAAAENETSESESEQTVELQANGREEKAVETIDKIYDLLNGAADASVLQDVLAELINQRDIAQAEYEKAVQEGREQDAIYWQGKVEEINSIIDTYKQYMTELYDGSGKVVSIVDATRKINQTTLNIFKKVDSELNEKNTQTILSTSKQIAAGVRKVAKITKNVKGIVSKVARASKGITKKVNSVYNNQIQRIFKIYNSDFRGLSKTLKKVKKAQEDSAVYSGLSEGMKGASTYMFFTPVGGEEKKIEKFSDKDTRREELTEVVEEEMEKGIDNN